MNFSPDERCGNRRPEIQFRNPPERQPVHRLKNRCRKIHVWKIPLWSKLLLLPHFQQFPYIAEPGFQLGNIILVEMPRAVDAAANLVDIRCNAVHGSSQLFLIGVIHLDDVAVDEHLAGIGSEISGSQLAHLLLNEIQLCLIQTDFLADGARAVCHGHIPLSFR